MRAVSQSLKECYGTDNYEKIHKMVYELRNRYVRSKGRKLQHEVLDPVWYDIDKNKLDHWEWVTL